MVILQCDGFFKYFCPVAQAPLSLIREGCWAWGVLPLGCSRVKPKGEPRVSLTQRLIQAHAAQGGVTLGPEQGELGANFCYLGRVIEVQDI